MKKINKIQIVLTIFLLCFGITNAQNVGVGTTSPTHKLHIKGQVRIDTLLSGTATDSVLVADPATGLLKRVSASRILIGNSTNTLSSTANTMTNTTNGVVATAPIINSVTNAFNTSTRALTTTVNGVAGAPVILTDNSDSTTASNGLNLNGKDVRLGGTLNTATTVTQGANTLSFTSTATNGFSVDGTTFSVDAANDRIGIGTTTPTGRLQVLGTTVIGNIPNPVNSGWNALQVQNDNGDQNNSFRLDGFGNDLVLGASSNPGSVFGTSISLTTAEAGQGESLRLRINPNGNVGIGTNTPTSLLDVNGTARIRTLNAGAASDSIVTSDSNGLLRRRNINSIIANIYNTDGTLTGERNVISNGNALNFVGSGAAGFPIRLKSSQATSSEISLGIFDRNTDTKGWLIGSNTYGNLSRELHFSTMGFANSGIRMKIDTGGNVAIGRNTDPAIRLAVQGGLSLGNGNFLPDTNYYKDDNFITFRHNGASEDFIGYRNNTFYFADCFNGADVAQPNVMVLGNLGVGNTTPAAKLHVAGNARITTMSIGSTTDSVVVVDNNGELKKIASSSIANSNQISLSASATVPALSIGDVGSITINVIGANVGDGVVVNPSSDLPAGVVIAYSRVSAANTVKVGFVGTGSSTAFTTNFDVKVIK